MFNLLRIKYHQFLEHWRVNDFLSAFILSIYKYEEAVPVKKDLAKLKPVIRKNSAPELQFIEITKDNYADLAIPHVLKSRAEKVAAYVQKGYCAFCIVADRKIVGDIWYVTKNSAKSDIIHPHIGWFNLEFGKDDVYMFDMYMDPEYRGDGLTTYFMNSALHRLSEKGYKNAYGYYAAANTSALWIYRLLGWEELPRFEVKRYFLYETVKPKTC